MALNKQSLSGSCNDFLTAICTVTKKQAVNAVTKTKNKSSAKKTITTNNTPNLLLAEAAAPGGMIVVAPVGMIDTEGFKLCCKDDDVFCMLNANGVGSTIA